MQFFKSVAVAVSALVAFAAAQSTEVAIHNFPSTVQVGKPTTLQILSQPGPFTLTLRRGDPDDLQNVTTITTTGSGSSFTWIPDSTLENGSDYAIMISQGSESNYTPEFTIAGGSSSSASSSSAASPSGYASSAAPSTLSTAAKTDSASSCAVTQIGDGQPQAPPNCTPVSSAAAAASSTPAATYAAPKVTPVSGFNSGAIAPTPAPYVPQPGATGSPAAPASNSTMPTYSVPAPTSGSGSSSGSSSSSASSGSASKAPTSGAAQFGSSLALIAGAAAAFAFLN